MDEINKVIEAIERDTVSGSVELADQLIQTILTHVPQLSSNEKKSILKKAEALTIKKPFFAVLKHIVETLKTSNTDWSTRLTAYQEIYNQVNIKIFKQLISLTGSKPKVYLLHSHSKTVVKVFEALALHNVESKIFQTRSEPEKEGTIQAERLKQMGFEVQLVDDDPSLSILEQIDYFVTGADLILPTCFINKSGTQRIADKITQLDKPYLVFADERKFTFTDVNFLPENFERIPRRLVTKIITGE